MKCGKSYGRKEPTILKILIKMELLKKTKWKLAVKSNALNLKSQRNLVGSEENPSDRGLESARDHDQGIVRDHDQIQKNVKDHVPGLENGKDRVRDLKTAKDLGQTQRSEKEHVLDQKRGNDPDLGTGEDDLDLGPEKIESNVLVRETGKDHVLEIVEDGQLRDQDLGKTAKDDQRCHGDLDHVTVGDLGNTPPLLPQVQLHLEIRFFRILAF